MPSVVSFPAAHEEALRHKHASPMALRVRHLAYQAGPTPILSGIDLNLTTDALTVLMGPNGAGKSVFLRLIHGLLQPTVGEITWDGQTLTKAIRKQQALVFQKPTLLRRSVRANLQFALGLRSLANRKERLEQALEEASLTDLASRPARVLSGGEQQRLALARALILEPKVLLLDEPTANLDPASVLMIEQIVRRVRRQGVKVILVTHDQHQAKRLGEEVVFLHKGHVSEHTPATDFFSNPKSDAARAYLGGEILV